MLTSENFMKILFSLTFKSMDMTHEPCWPLARFGNTIWLSAICNLLEKLRGNFFAYIKCFGLIQPSWSPTLIIYDGVTQHQNTNLKQWIKWILWCQKWGQETLVYKQFSIVYWIVFFLQHYVTLFQETNSDGWLSVWKKEIRIGLDLHHCFILWKVSYNGLVWFCEENSLAVGNVKRL